MQASKPTTRTNQKRGKVWYIVKVAGFDDLKAEKIKSWQYILLVPASYPLSAKNKARRFAFAHEKKLPMEVTARILSQNILEAIKNKEIVEL